jgi:hypothetical protein
MYSKLDVVRLLVGCGADTAATTEVRASCSSVFAAPRRHAAVRVSSLSNFA